jgi:hypothetical protein
MEEILGVFREAIGEENGYKLAQVFTPVAPANDPGRLYTFHRALSASSIQAELRNEIIYKSQRRMPKVESNAWIEVFTCYWRAIGELLAAEEAMNVGKKSEWKKVYEAWKEVLNAFHRGYTANNFDAWTIPCLYTCGKYLRNFALKADEQARQSDGNVTYNQGLQDDVVSTLGKNENLQDAARQINRLFGLCLSDRCCSLAKKPASSLKSVLTCSQVTTGGVQKMGSLLLHKSPLQALLQGNEIVATPFLPLN